MSQSTVPQSKESTSKTVADSFSKSVMLMSVLMIAQRGIGFLRSCYVCDALPSDEVGRWDLAFNFLVIAAPLTVFGIPGSFGRYVARYENAGQTRRLLRHTLLACLGLTACSCLLAFYNRDSLANYFFGDPNETQLVSLLTLGMPVVIFFNFLNSWFGGRRLNRFVFRTEFTQTLVFAIACFVGFQFFRADAATVIFAYLLSCTTGLLLGISLSLAADRMPRQAIDKSESLEIWRKILPFAVWVWASNTLLNLFGVCDRILIVNFLPEGSGDVQYLIGQYHTACIFPALLVSIGAMAGAMVIPYLSKDWETGDREAVTHRVNLMLKSVGLICLVGSVAVLTVAPILFGGLWKNKFAMGESLLPLTLTYCSLTAMTYVADKYFWCIEKTAYSTAWLGIGLVVNFVVGYWLIVPYGILGVIASTLIAHLFVLIGILLHGHRYGMTLDPGVLLVGVSLTAVCFGTATAVACLAILVVAALCTETLFDRASKQQAQEKIAALVFPNGRSQ